MSSATLKQSLALMLALLILTLPVQTALAVSGIASTSVTGRDGAQNTVKARDQITVQAEVSIDGELEITRDQVWFNTFMFDSCVPNGLTTLCTFTTPKTSDATWPTRTSYTIGVYRDNPTGINGNIRPDAIYLIGSQVQGAINLDTQRPDIRLTFNRARSGTIITANARVTDLPQACSGVKSITFSSAAGEQVFDYTPNTCLVDQAVTIDVSSLAERGYPLTVTALDYLGNTQTTVGNFTVDKTAGNFRDFQIKDFAGLEVRHVNARELETRVSIKAGTDVLAVTADLTQLTKNTVNTDVPGQCQMHSDGLYCDWLVTLSPDAYGVNTVTFKAEDQFGNAGEVPFQKLIERDVDGPLAVQLSTSLSQIAPYYLKKDNNTIRVTFSESGSGLKASDVRLDLRALHGPGDLAATRCTPSWECVWDNLNFQIPDGRYQISLSAAPDKLGNPLRQAFSGEVVLDTQAPLDISVSARSVGGVEMFDGFAVAGDSIEVIARLTEATSIEEAYGDFSAFIPGLTLAPDDGCELIDNVWECKWVVGPISRRGAIEDRIRLTFIDTLQNRRTAYASLKVYALDNTTRNLWSSSVECSPSKIDRQVASLIEQKVICSVNLQGTADIISMQLDPCTGDPALLKSYELFNAPGTNPYLRLTLNPTEISNNSLKFSCPLRILSKTGNSIITTPEIETIPISLSVYKVSLEDYGKSVEEKIQMAKDDANGGLWTTITSLRKLISYAEKICSLIRTLNNIASLWSIIGAVWRGTADTLYTIPTAQAAAAAAEKKGQADQTISSTINQRIKGDFMGLGDENGAINKFCKFISCNIFYDDIDLFGGTGDDIGDWQSSVMKYANTVSTGGEYGASLGLGGQGINAFNYKEGPEGNQGGNVQHREIQGGRLNPKDSLVLSVLTVCIPGIVVNLDKYRQIQCMYADCLQSGADAGVPLHACEDAKAYEMCKYVYGEIFQLLPFAGLLNYFIGLVKNVLYNPLSLIDVYLGYQCQQPISTPGASSIAKWCLFKETLGLIESVISDLSEIKDGWEIQTDYCARIDDEED